MDSWAALSTNISGVWTNVEVDGSEEAGDFAGNHIEGFVGERD